MKLKVAEYIADFFVERGINQVFTVVGGGAMHLNDAFGHNNKMNCIYNHHEQASAIAAEAFGRLNDSPAIVCVTSGPGATNAITGVAGAWVDSIPMIIISGQTKSTLTVGYSGLNLRSLGNQEINIIPMIEHITKYSKTILEVKELKFELEKAVFISQNGRPGPVWLDIPLDIQGTYIDENNFSEKVFNPIDYQNKYSNLNAEITFIIEKIKKAKRPVFYAGNGIRLSKGYEEFLILTKKLNIPVVTCWNSIDLLSEDCPLYVGRAGTMGNRAGNFAVQNSDLILAVGTRMNIYQVGYDVKSWARNAFTIVVDIDKEELKKKTVRIDKGICSDAKEFMQLMNKTINVKELSNIECWKKQCNKWKVKYPVVMKKHYVMQEKVNVYAFIQKLSQHTKKNDIVVVANGSASVVGSQAFEIKDGVRFIMNCELSSMGYELPAAIGASLANNRKKTICIAGDGSIQMNLQELQTIITNRLPVKIFIINNEGYQQIRLTQKNIFNGKLVGVGKDSDDLGFPSFGKLAQAYGYKYVKVDNNEDLDDKILESLKGDKACICELFVSINQIFEPKSATKTLKDGTLVSAPLEDMAPFLSKKELESNMIIETKRSDN
ncbi:MAG: thiamine pyrophosphate-binding protein [Erysipelotrichaceae bacterium]